MYINFKIKFMEIEFFCNNKLIIEINDLKLFYLLINFMLKLRDIQINCYLFFRLEEQGLDITEQCNIKII